MKKTFMVLLSAILVLTSCNWMGIAVHADEQKTADSGRDSIETELRTAPADSEKNNSSDSSADQTRKFGFLSYTISNGEATITGCDTLASGKIAIPGVLDGAKVTTIGSWAFRGCTGISEVTIPTSVKSIESNAFRDCQGLVDITIPNSVQKIGEETFEHCSKLSNIVLPNSITKIDNSVFSGCTRLTDIIIPKSITSIGISAFYKCTGLSSVVIPDSVTSIGSRSFEECSGLKNIGLSNSLTNIGNSCFQDCTELKKIKIPNSVISVGDGAFRNCTGLTKATLSNNMTNIGEGVFRNCRKLTSIIIPKGVTRIDDSAFFFCEELRNVSIPDSVTDIEAFAFCTYSDLKEVYYAGSKEQWNAIYISGSYNDRLKDAHIHYNSTAPDDGDTIDIAEGKYGIEVEDIAGNPIEGASVKYDSQEAKTDSDGLAIFTEAESEIPLIVVSKSGYREYTNENTDWTRKDSRLDRVTLLPETCSPLEMATVNYRNILNKNEIGLSVNLLREVKKVKIPVKGLVGDLDFSDFSIVCKAVTNEADDYEIWQGQKKIKEAKDGRFTLKSSDFAEGGKCFIRAYDKERKSYDTDINLIFEKNSPVENTEIKLSDDASFAVSNDIPFVGGGTITVSLPLIPVMLDVEGDTIRVGFNTKQIEDLKDENTWSDIKKKCDLLGEVKDKLSSESMKDIQKYVNEQKSKLPGGDKPLKTHVIGYAEGNVMDETIQGKLYLVIEYKSPKAAWNTVVVVVPVTAWVSATGKAEIGAEIGYEIKEKSLNGNIFFNPSAGLNAFGGVGFSDLVGVGAYGSGTISAELNLGTNSGAEVNLEGEAGLKAYVLDAEYNRPFAYHKWNLYKSPDKAAASKVALVGASASGRDDSYLSGIYDASSYHKASLKYLESESSWMGSNRNFEEDALVGAASSDEGEIENLLTNTYRNAEPFTLSDGSNAWLTFLKADSSTGDIFTVVSRLKNGSWTEPVRMDATDTLDGAPKLAKGKDGSLWIAYTRQKKDAKGTSLAEKAKARELVVSRLNPESLSVEETHVYNAEGYLNMFDLREVAGQMTAAWAVSPVTDDNSVLTPSGAALYTAKVANGSFGEAEEKANVTGDSVLQICLGEKNGSAALAYKTSANEGTLYVLNGNTSEKLAEQVSGSIRYGNIFGANTFIWNSQNSFSTSDGRNFTAEGATSEYSFTDSGIYYTMVSNDQNHKESDTKNSTRTEVREILKDDDGNISDAACMYEDSHYLEDITAFRVNNQDKIIGLNTSVDTGDSEVVKEKDLVSLNTHGVNDISIVDAKYDEDKDIGGTELPVTLTLHNGGTDKVTSVDISNGTSASTMPVSLEPGKECEVTASVKVPEKKSDVTFHAVETGKNENESDSKDNDYTITVGSPDLSVDLSYGPAPGSEDKLFTFYATVSNTGANATSGDLKIKDGSDNVLAETSIDSIARGDKQVIRFDISMDVADKVITAEVESDNGELYTSNNQATIYAKRVERTSKESENKFSDIHKDQFYYEAVQWGTSHSIIAGFNEKDGSYTFHPNDICTRAQFVTFLWRTFGSQKPKSTKNPFVDISNIRDVYYCDAVLWAYENGYVSGYSDPKGVRFGADDEVTRGQVVTFLWRAAGSPKPASSKSSFADVKNPSGQYYGTAMLWASENGIVSGYSDPKGARFAPDDSCTRGQVVTFLWRYAQKFLQ